jgi:hypothetical protein
MTESLQYHRDRATRRNVVRAIVLLASSLDRAEIENYAVVPDLFDRVVSIVLPDIFEDDRELVGKSNQAVYEAVVELIDAINRATDMLTEGRNDA